MNAIEKNYIQVNGSQLCYRRLGEGPIMMLLHPSPRSGEMMEPLMHLLATHFTVLAPDTPGYGESGAPIDHLSSMDDYTYFIEGLRKHFKTDKITLYGSASGAQLAIAYALRFRDHIAHLFLDNAAHFEDEMRNQILQHYFIDLIPKPDNSHIEYLYQHVKASCLFFPWYDQIENNRIAQILPPDNIIDSIVRDYLLAGPNYANAYRAAFLHERAEKVQALQVPTIIFRWKGSPILKHIDALIEQSVPTNIQVVETPIDIKDRYEMMNKIMIF
ncbi:MAG: alpha/beta hydrolase [Sphingobacteriia bacterium]|jgi:pimeloyl-ACP methyl ester carboxylesterase